VTDARRKKAESSKKFKAGSAKFYKEMNKEDELDGAWLTEKYGPGSN